MSRLFLLAALTLCWGTAQARVITLSPHATELVIAAGAAEQLVGAVPVPDLPANQRPYQAQDIAAFGGIDREQITKLAPTLAVVWPSGNRSSDIRWLEQQGIKVFRSEPGKLADIPGDIRALGRLLGTQTQAESNARQFAAVLATPCKAPTQNIYVDIWNHPAMTIGGEAHWLNDALEYAGYRNILSDVPLGVFSIEREAQTAVSSQRRLAMHPWRSEHDLDGSQLNRPSPRILAALKRLCDSA